MSSWVEALPYIVYSYNKMYIPGTRVSPFMLRTGKQPMLPEDLQSVNGSCQNQTYQDRMDEVTSRFEVYSKVVAEAHDLEKQRQKIHYDKDKYDVHFDVGDQVLWLTQNPKDKLFLKWFGPYLISKKVNDVSYEIEDQIDGEKRVVSVQQIVPFEGEFDLSAETEARNEAQDKLGDLRYGQFVILKRNDDQYADQYHVGRVVEEYDSLTGKITILHYIDMGAQGNSLRVHAKARAPLKKRKLSPEMYDADGEPYTVGRGKTPITKPNGTECQIDYYVDSLAEVVAKNFSLDDKGMIPSDVLLQVKAFERGRAQAKRNQ